MLRELQTSGLWFVHTEALGGEVILCVAGDIHGALTRLYENIAAFEAELDVTFTHVLHVGDFGVWPDPRRVDRATREHGGPGEFAIWLADQRPVPRPTLFIKGNHEDFDWLEGHPTGELLPGLRYLRSGSVAELTASGETIRVGGIGGCHGPSNFERRSRDLRGSARRHYTRDEIEALGSDSRLDILLTHDAPAGVPFTPHSRAPYVSAAAGLDELLGLVRPRVCFFGHHHARVRAEIAGVPCVGLNFVGRTGHLVAIDLRDTSLALLGEWPRASSGPPSVGALAEEA